MAWNTQIIPQDTKDFLTSLDHEVTSSIGVYFSTLAMSLSNSTNNTLCVNGIFHVEKYKPGRLELHYHIDTDDRFIRITKHDLII